MTNTLAQDFKRHFLGGLAAMLPTILTLVIFVFVFQFIQRYIGDHLSRFAQWVTVQFICFWHRYAEGYEGSFLGPATVWKYVKTFWANNHLDLVGFLLAFVGIYILGRFVNSLLGRSLWRFFDDALCKLPLTRNIYPQVKQVTDYFFGKEGLQFSQVVAVEYPRKGIWSMGLVTSGGMKCLAEEAGERMLTLFIPSSPTPMTGYTITVKKSEVVELPMSIDEAFRFTISGGMILPPGQGTRDASLPGVEMASQDREETVS